MLRLVPLFALAVLTACANTMPHDSFRPADSDTVMQSGAIVGDNEVAPETGDSLEVSAVSGAVIRAVLKGDFVVFSATDKDVPTLTEYVDEDCEYCREYDYGLRSWILETYVATGKLKLARAFVPLSARGMLFASATLCAAEKNAYDGMHSYLTTHPTADQAAILKQHAALKLNQATLKYCITTKKIPAAIFKDGSPVLRVPAFEIGHEKWLGIETKAQVKARLEKAL